MHGKRWLTGLIAVPCLIYIIGFGPRGLFQGLIVLVSIVALFEFFKLAGVMPALPVKITAALLTLFLFFFISRGPFFMVPAGLPLLIFVPLCLYLFNKSLRERAVQDMGAVALGFLYTCMPLALLILIDKHPRGSLWIFFLLAVIFASDTGAYYFGRLFGKHKLFPSVSPGKTWEGAVGGLLSGLFIAFWFPLFVPVQRQVPQLLVLGAALSVAGQIGDLSESMLKRNRGVKDSGNILPGHGGILDRIDGLLFAVPLLYIYLTYAIV